MVSAYLEIFNLDQISLKRLDCTGNFWGYNAILSEQHFLCLGANEAFSNFPQTVPGALSAGPIKTQLSLISNARNRLILAESRWESLSSFLLVKDEQTLLQQSWKGIHTEISVNFTDVKVFSVRSLPGPPISLPLDLCFMSASQQVGRERGRDDGVSRGLILMLLWQTRLITSIGGGKRGKGWEHDETTSRKTDR